MNKVINSLCLALICALFVDNGLSNVISSPRLDNVNLMSGRIIGGSNAVLGQFPFQVSIQWSFLGLLTHFCGGSIIHRYYIISAAHCMFDHPRNGHMEIFAGANNILLPNAQELVIQQRTDVEEQWVHEDFAPSISPNDIVLIRVTTPFVFNEYVKPIRLPPSNYYPSGMGAASGWGSLLFTGTGVSPILQFAILPVIEFHECNKLLLSLGAGDLPQTNFCTGPLSGGLSTCSGDSGGPFVQIALDENGSEEYFLIGIVSWGYVPCALPNRPQVFVNVADYIEWINDIVIWD